MTIDQIFEILESAEFSPLIRSRNVVIPCPFAAVGDLHKHRVDMHPSLGFLPTDDDAIWNCFTCKRSGRIRNFFESLEALLGWDVDSVLEKLDRMLEVDVEFAAASVPDFDAHAKPKERRDYPRFPESWLAPYKGVVPKYILTRGLQLQTCKAWGLGYDKPAQRVVFPVRDFRRELVGAVGGLIRKHPREPKYKNYWHRVHRSCGMPVNHRNSLFYCPACGSDPISEREVREGFRKSNFLYGEHFAQGKTLIVVEGLIDCLRVWEAFQGSAYAPVALFGSAPSSVQADQIVRLSGDSRRVILMLDNDRAGESGMADLAAHLRKRLRVFRVNYEREGVEPGADPGALDFPTLRSLVEEADVLL